jgi:hypothetical protein
VPPTAAFLSSLLAVFATPFPEAAPRTAATSAMSKKGGKKAAGGGELSRFLQSHLQTITDTLQVCPRRIPILPGIPRSFDFRPDCSWTSQMMAEAAPAGLMRTDWSEVVALGDVVSRQATVGESEIRRILGLILLRWVKIMRV